MLCTSEIVCPFIKSAFVHVKFACMMSVASVSEDTDLCVCNERTDSVARGQRAHSETQDGVERNKLLLLS